MENIISETNEFPKGATSFIIHQLRKSANNSLDSLTELIDDSIDAVKNGANATISITHDKLNKVLVVDELNNGCGMDENTVFDFFNSFETHNFMDAIISKFGLGRWYPIAKIPTNPNIHLDTSRGDGILIHADLDITDENWKKVITKQPCRKNVRGTKIWINDVNEDEFPSDDKVIEYLSEHYAYANVKIIFNGNVILKNDPLYISKLPNGFDTSDGLYVKDGIVHNVKTHEFTEITDDTDDKGNKIVNKIVLQTIATSISAKALYGWIKDEGNNIKERAAERGGVWTCVGTNLLNKGNNGEYFDSVLTRGGSGVTRYFIKVKSDPKNALHLNDVKARGFDNFFNNKKELNKYTNKNSEGLYNVLDSEFRNCKGFYNLVGQEKKHFNLTDNEIYTRIMNKMYPPKIKKGTSRKVCNKLKKFESAQIKIHIDAINQLFDYETDDKGIVNVTIPHNSNDLKITLNAKNLPDNFKTLTKEDIILNFADFLINDIHDSKIFDTFNKKFSANGDN